MQNPESLFISQDKLKIATCLFPVSGEILENSSYIKKFIREVASNNCDIIQFPEQALSGYPPLDIPSFNNYKWDLLRAETKDIMALPANDVYHNGVPSGHSRPLDRKSLPKK